MRQLSLLDTYALAGAMPAIRAAMSRVAGDAEGEGRKALVDKINRIARQEGIRLTGGNVKNISKDTLDKWLSPTDTAHAPGVNAILTFCIATNDFTPLGVMLRPFGLDIMTHEDRRLRDIAKADEEIKALRQRKRNLEGMR